MKNKVTMVFSTVPDAAQGRAMAEELVGAGLAACVNLVPGLVSVYRWEGDIQADSECLMIIKTREDAVASIREWILERHPYELPEVVAVPVTDGLPPYLDWVTGSVRPPSQ